jgi:Lipid A core - O-antigen ligase and related enzymes
MAEALRTFAGLTLLTALAVAPLYFGATRLVPFQTLIALAGAGGVAWALSAVTGAQWAAPPLPALIAVALILVSAVAWWLVLTPPELPSFTRGHFARIVSRWPNSVVPKNFPLLLAWAFVGMLAFVALCDFAREATWRRSIVWTILVTGAVIAVLGLIQNATRARGIYWLPSHRMPGAFFGTFFHHTAAGAYLNTAWPLGISLALLGIERRTVSRLGIGVALACTAVILAAHSGHISRLPQVVAVAILVGLALWCGIWRAFGRVPGLRPALAGIGAALALAVAVFGATRVDDIRSRWAQLSWDKLAGRGPVVAPAPESEWKRLMRDDLFIPSDHSAYPLGDRGAAYAAALGAIADRPWFGWGPGGWMAGAAANSTDPFTRSFFLTVQFTHQDLLQGFVEWGVFGGTGWALLFGGAVAIVVLRLRGSPSRDYLGAGAAAALGAVLLQSLIDFPLQIPAVHFNALALAAVAWTVPASGKLPVRFADSVVSPHECAQSH